MKLGDKKSETELQEAEKKAEKWAKFQN
jgi:hypothetical protein